MCSMIPGDDEYDADYNPVLPDIGSYHGTPVLEFHEAFGHPVESVPTVPSIEQRVLRCRLLAEELCEFADAAGVEIVIKNDGVSGHVIEVQADPRLPPVNMVECADGLGDLRYVVDGGNLIFGFPGPAVFAEIHRSNMSKLGPDGRPIMREDGKTLKGPNYTRPDIASILEAASAGSGT